MITIGMRAHDLGKQPLAELAQELEKRTIPVIQLAINKALADFPYSPGCMSPGYARTIRKTLANHGVEIAVLGAYVNLIHPDPHKRTTELNRYREHLQFAREFGCSVVGTETGHRSPDGSAVPETQSTQAFTDLVESVKSLSQTAEQFGVFMGIEPVAHKHPLSSVERTAQLLHRVGSPNVKIIFDPVNLIPQQGLPNQKDFFTSAFQAFGPEIVIIHAKDFRIENNQKVGNLPAGTGDLDYQSLMAIVQKEKKGIEVLLEDTNPQVLDSALAYVRNCAAFL